MLRAQRIQQAFQSVLYLSLHAHENGNGDSIVHGCSDLMELWGAQTYPTTE